MQEVKLGEKGQITLPKQFRTHYGLSKGDQLKLIDLGNGIIEVILTSHSRALQTPKIKSKVSASTEDMKKAVGQAATNKYKEGSKR